MVASRAPPTGNWPATQACVLAGIQAGDPLVGRTQASIQSTEPHQPGLKMQILIQQVYVEAESAVLTRSQVMLMLLAHEADFE